MALVQPDIYAAVARLLESGQRGALCVVVRATGSVPGKLGAKMLLFANGSQLGTIGGAGLEEQVKARAREAIATGRSGCYRFDLSKWKPGGLNSLCGGTVEIYVEALIPLPHLLLCGGGHVAQALARQCDLLGYRYAVLDDRPDYLDSALFPTATGRYLSTPEQLLPPELELAAYSHIYLLGYSWELDARWLAAILPQTAHYVGAIGSKSKAAALRRELAEQGLAAGTIDRLVCPVGLAIGAESPAEIAVAVVADLIQQTKPAAAAGSTTSPPA